MSCPSRPFTIFAVVCQKFSLGEAAANPQPERTRKYVRIAGAAATKHKEIYDALH